MISPISESAERSASVHDRAARMDGRRGCGSPTNKEPTIVDSLQHRQVVIERNSKRRREEGGEITPQHPGHEDGSVLVPKNADASGRREIKRVRFTISGATATTEPIILLGKMSVSRRRDQATPATKIQLQEPDKVALWQEIEFLTAKLFMGVSVEELQSEIDRLDRSWNAPELEEHEASEIRVAIGSLLTARLDACTAVYLVGARQGLEGALRQQPNWAKLDFLSEFRTRLDRILEIKEREARKNLGGFGDHLLGYGVRNYGKLSWQLFVRSWQTNTKATRNRMLTDYFKPCTIGILQRMEDRLSRLSQQQREHPAVKQFCSELANSKTQRMQESALHG